MGSVGIPWVTQVALAMPLAKLLSQQLLGVSVGVVSGVNSMTEEQRAVVARGPRWKCRRFLGPAMRRVRALYFGYFESSMTGDSWVFWF